MEDRSGSQGGNSTTWGLMKSYGRGVARSITRSKATGTSRVTAHLRDQCIRDQMGSEGSGDGSLPLPATPSPVPPSKHPPWFPGGSNGRTQNLIRM